VALKRAFAKRRVHKRYVALVHGALDGEGVVDAPLALAGGLVRVKMAVRADGLPSRTRWKARARAGEYTLVDCWPETGRQHQIRAHLDHLGHPIVGDKLYPDETVFATYQDHGWEAVADKLALPRQALHAAELRFPHPTTGDEVVIESALPADLRVLMTQE
jgi:23S rRNA pseudouridine1911/1915/1917 synthase